MQPHGVDGDVGRPAFAGIERPGITQARLTFAAVYPRQSETGGIRNQIGKGMRRGRCVVRRPGCGLPRLAAVEGACLIVTSGSEVPACDDCAQAGDAPSASSVAAIAGLMRNTHACVLRTSIDEASMGSFLSVMHRHAPAMITATTPQSRLSYYRIRSFQERTGGARGCAGL